MPGVSCHSSWWEMPLLSVPSVPHRHRQCPGEQGWERRLWNGQGAPGTLCTHKIREREQFQRLIREKCHCQWSQVIGFSFFLPFPFLPPCKSWEYWDFGILQKPLQWCSSDVPKCTRQPCCCSCRRMQVPGSSWSCSLTPGEQSILSSSPHTAEFPSLTNRTSHESRKRPYSSGKYPNKFHYCQLMEFKLSKVLWFSYKMVNVDYYKEYEYDDHFPHFLFVPLISRYPCNNQVHTHY